MDTVRDALNYLGLPLTFLVEQKEGKNNQNNNDDSPIKTKLTKKLNTAFRKAAIGAHPDKGGSPEAFVLLSKAKEIIETTIEYGFDKGEAKIGMNGFEDDDDSSSAYWPWPGVSAADAVVMAANILHIDEDDLEIADMGMSDEEREDAQAEIEDMIGEKADWAAKNDDDVSSKEIDAAWWVLMKLVESHDCE
jgi:hypothetical protein